MQTETDTEDTSIQVRSFSPIKTESEENFLKRRVSEVNVNFKMKYDSRPNHQQQENQRTGESNVVYLLLGYVCQLLNRVGFGAFGGRGVSPRKYLEFQVLTNYKKSEIDLTKPNAIKSTRVVFESFKNDLEQELLELEKLRDKVIK